jgi:hypothetical protein
MGLSSKHFWRAEGALGQVWASSQAQQSRLHGVCTGAITMMSTCSQVTSEQ